MLTLEQVRQFLYYEARLLDDRQWDDWLNCYSPRTFEGTRTLNSTL